MKKSIVFLSLFLSSCTAAQISQTISEADKMLTTGTAQPLTSGEVGSGLKEALINGISKGADITSQLDGYFKNPEIKIPFPPDVKKVEVDKFVMTLNRGAEDAAKEAKPIFIAAIKQMTIEDAFALLKGQPDAATQFLKRTTTAQLKDKFKPVVQASLDKVSATKYYGDIVNNYNRIPFIDKVNPDLNDYATDMAIQGLFTMIAKEEKNIRQDPLARTTELLKRVFGSQK
jgi:hypothetical protein